MRPRVYEEKVRNSKCCVCNVNDCYGEGHHFPQGRVRTDKLWKKIPLCRPCHRWAHDKPKDFVIDNFVNIVHWILNTTVKEKENGK